MLAILPCFSTPGLAVIPEASEPIPVKNGEPGGIQPRSRSISIAPECYYNNGVVTITADRSISYINATVTRLEDSRQWSNSSTGNNLLIDITTEPGTYMLELTLSNGMSYYGEYIL